VERGGDARQYLIGWEGAGKRATVRCQNELSPAVFYRQWAPPVAVVESPPVLQHDAKEGKMRSSLLEGKHGVDVAHCEGEKAMAAAGSDLIPAIRRGQQVGLAVERLTRTQN
jgi:hypothetical protein